MKSNVDSWTIRCDLNEKKKRVAFGKECKDLRLQKGLSLESMAKRMFIPTELLIRIEEGKVCPDAADLKKKLRYVKESQRLKIG